MSTSTAPKAVLVTASVAATSALKNFGVVGGSAGFFNGLVAALAVCRGRGAI